MNKILKPSQLKNKDLRNRKDISAFQKTAIHYFNEEGEDKWLQWFDLLDYGEREAVYSLFNINEGFILRQRKRNQPTFCVPIHSLVSIGSLSKKKESSVVECRLPKNRSASSVSFCLSFAKEK
jgi:hypothetical protein